MKAAGSPLPGRWNKVFHTSHVWSMLGSASDWETLQADRQQFVSLSILGRKRQFSNLSFEVLPQINLDVQQLFRPERCVLAVSNWEQGFGGGGHHVKQCWQCSTCSCLRRGGGGGGDRKRDRVRADWGAGRLGHEMGVGIDSKEKWEGKKNETVVQHPHLFTSYSRAP